MERPFCAGNHGLPLHREVRSMNECLLILMLDQTQTVPKMRSAASNRVSDLITTQPILDGIPENELESFFAAAKLSKAERRSRNVTCLLKAREDGSHDDCELNGCEADEGAILGTHREAPRWLATCCRSDGDLKSLRWYELSSTAKKTGWCFGTWMLFFHSVGNVIIPTDEIILFQRGRLNHQPENIEFLLLPLLNICRLSSHHQCNSGTISRDPGVTGCRTTNGQCEDFHKQILPGIPWEFHGILFHHLYPLNPSKS